MLNTRHAKALLPAILSTLVLLLSMQALIQQTADTPIAKPTVELPLWTALLEPPPPPKEKSLPDREWVKPVDVPGYNVPKDHVVDDLDLPPRPTSKRPVIDFGPPSAPNTHDQPLVATIRIAPTYPPALAARSTEGYVQVIFDVLPSGQVANVKVIDSSHRGFEKPAIEAARRFQFRARVVDGTAVLTENVGYRFRFEMDESAKTH